MQAVCVKVAVGGVGVKVGATVVVGVGVLVGVGGPSLDKSMPLGARPVPDMLLLLLFLLVLVLFALLSVRMLVLLLLLLLLLFLLLPFLLVLVHVLVLLAWVSLLPPPPQQPPPLLLLLRPQFLVLPLPVPRLCSVPRHPCLTSQRQHHGLLPSSKAPRRGPPCVWQPSLQTH